MWEHLIITYKLDKTNQMRHSITLALTLLIFSTQTLAEKQPANDKEKFSYAVGVQLAQNITRQNIEIDLDSFLQAIRDIVTSSPLKVSVDEMQTVLNSYRDKEIKRQGELAVSNKVAGEKFLADNKSKEGVVTIPGGLQYKIINEGSGKNHRKMTRL